MNVVIIKMKIIKTVVVRVKIHNHLVCCAFFKFSSNFFLKSKCYFSKRKKKKKVKFSLTEHQNVKAYAAHNVE